VVSVILAATAASAASECAGGPADAPFRVVPRTPGAVVVVEVWPVGAPEGWTDAVLDALDRHGVSSVVLLPAGADPAPWLGLLTRVAASGHTLGVVLPDALVPSGPGDAGRLRESIRPLEKSGEPIRTAVTRVGSLSIESTLAKVGLRSLLDSSGSPDGAARVAAHLDGQTPSTVVLPPGPWSGDAPARCAPFRPADADRVSRTLERAVASGGVPVVRWVLSGRGGDLQDAQVVDRWLTAVAEASGARFGTAEDARAAVFAGLRGPATPASAQLAAHSVDAASVDAAVEALMQLEVLPRTLPGGLSPTEAFLALALRATGHDEAVLHLPAVSGPAQLAGPSSMQTPIDREALVTWARALLEGMPPELPSAARIGDRLVPARELLVAMASLVRGDDPLVAHPVSDPDPNARGLGWGTVGETPAP
jgi:hypothetical protein